MIRYGSVFLSIINSNRSVTNIINEVSITEGIFQDIMMVNNLITRITRKENPSFVYNNGKWM